jgi:hypothetical protein
MLLMTLCTMILPYVRDEIKKYSQRYADSIEKHPTYLMRNFMRSIKTPRRLKKGLPQDLSI